MGLVRGVPHTQAHLLDLAADGRTDWSVRWATAGRLRPRSPRACLRGLPLRLRHPSQQKLLLQLRLWRKLLSGRIRSSRPLNRHPLVRLRRHLATYTDQTSSSGVNAGPWLLTKHAAGTEHADGTSTAAELFGVTSMRTGGEAPRRG